jgi:hypothetical protein
MDLVRGLIRNRINLLARLFCHKSRCVWTPSMYRLLFDCDSGSFDRCFPSPLMILMRYYFSHFGRHVARATQHPRPRWRCDTYMNMSTLEYVLVF